MTTFNTAVKNDSLSDETLDSVAGGLNPQPLPPGPPESFRSFFSHFAVNQHFSLPSFSFLKFRF
jgi:hypothetical protein